MVAHLLGNDDIDLDLQQFILAKTEGIPFFIEELSSPPGARHHQARGGHGPPPGRSHSLAIPSTIQDMIMARVDHLPDPAKTVLQVGSVIEREFPHELIRKAANLPEPELLTYLSALKEAELLYERGIYPQTSYIFRHALTREVVYNSILARRRKELHHLIGKALRSFARMTSLTTGRSSLIISFKAKTTPRRRTTENGPPKKRRQTSFSPEPRPTAGSASSLWSTCLKAKLFGGRSSMPEEPWVC